MCLEHGRHDFLHYFILGSNYIIAAHSSDVFIFFFLELIVVGETSVAIKGQISYSHLTRHLTSLMLHYGSAVAMGILFEL